MADAQLDESQVSEETEFEAAFAEFADKDKSEDIEPEPPQEEELDAKKDDEAEEPKAEDKEAESPADDDPYAGMSEEVKAKFIALEKDKDDLEHRLKSDAGRVSAFQRQINDLTRTVDEMSASKEADKPTDKQIAEAMKGTDDDWEAFKEDYPAVAEAIDRRLERVGEATQETIDKTLEPVNTKLDEVTKTSTEAANQAAVDAVAEDFPNWTEAVKTPEFAEWLDEQSPGVNALASSDNTADAKTLIGLYDAHLVAAGKDSLRAPDPNEPGVTDEEEEAKGSDEPSELEKRRAQQLEDGTAIPSKSAGIDPDGTPGGTEFEQAFDYYAKKKAAQRTA